MIENRDNQDVLRLKAAGWRSDVRRRLDALARTYKGTCRACVFDFDHTMVHGDLGDAVLRRLAADGLLDESSAAPALSSSIRVPGERRPGEGPASYYEALKEVSMSVDGQYAEPNATAYAWAVQVMAGLTPADVVAAARRVLSTSVNGGDDARPFPYPEMVDLAGLLLRSGLRVFVVSATNVWSMRWAVLNVINPELRNRFGSGIEITPANVVGISLLMREIASGRVFSDAQLVRQDPAYRRLEQQALSRFVLTPLQSFPISTYTGKVGCLRTLLDEEPPLLAAGDSDNDLPLLESAQHRLWIAHLDDVPTQLRAAATGAARRNWLVQPVGQGSRPRFVPSEVEAFSKGAVPSHRHSIEAWKQAGHLMDF